MPNAQSKYWNPVVETLPREKLATIELKNFRQYLQYAKDHSEFYRKKYRSIDPRAIETIEDIRNLPLIDKVDLREAQEDKEPYTY